MVKVLSKLALASAALALTAGPALAQGSASALSLRASTAAENASQVDGPPVVAIIGLVAIIGGGIYLAVDGNNDEPDSP